MTGMKRCLIRILSPVGVWSCQEAYQVGEPVGEKLCSYTHFGQHKGGTQHNAYTQLRAIAQ